ncbi:hypothetical protein MmonteBS_35290 [Mycobacterium montefiorense]|uniref:Uncharacterized protein n=1 Tax=Mycobacterium montefiorense TaxID=154654 RepID=A0ABQ0NQS4_9MYCO|nr:hypothetical protein MmonteBS_35290 [Mycobacterium montefiorense]GKU53518.1 hypothetical protein NJB14195_47590 [Mycobacterium montefiorense]GKU66764.1 hypothetical protein NJB18183_19110 [Mycobacterium montefiorense]
MKPPICEIEPVDDSWTFERMIEVMAGLAPILKANAKFMGSVTRRHPFMLFEAEVFKKVPDSAECSFADIDRAYLLGFDQRYRNSVPKRNLQIRRCHPSRSAATYNYYSLQHTTSP